MPGRDRDRSRSSVPVSGLTAGQSYYFALVATNSSGTTDGSLALFTTAAATPVVTTGQASSVGTTGATLSGSVQPQGLTTSYYFEYGTSPTSLTSHTATVDAGSGSGSVPATATVSGLKSNQTYYFALVATNSSGTGGRGARAVHDRARQPPSATTGQASAIGSTTATLSGSVDPGALATTDHFEYGRSATELSSKTPTFDDGVRVGIGFGDRDVARPEAGQHLRVPAGGDELLRNELTASRRRSRRSPRASRRS